MPEVTVEKWSDIRDQEQLLSSLDEIFFEASKTKTFESHAHRAAFRERWLGQFLRADPQLTFLAWNEGRLAGYVCGSLEDPVRSTRFSDLNYFSDFANLTRRFPAQLHINISQSERGKGIGGLLISRFCTEAGEAGAPGVHVVTERDARNVEFYLRNHFEEVGSTNWKDRVLVFLGRHLTQR